MFYTDKKINFRAVTLHLQEKALHDFREFSGISRILENVILGKFSCKGVLRFLGEWLQYTRVRNMLDTYPYI